MIETPIAQPARSPETRVKFFYHIAMPHPDTHLFEVTLQVQGWQAAVLDLKMPVWTPGSYLVREYARHVQQFTAQADTPLPWQKHSKNHWQVQTRAPEITVTYQVFANELTVRTNHLDRTHGYFNPAALCFYVPGFEQEPVQITIAPPYPDWRVTTPLPAVDGQPYTYTAADFDTLVDSPFEVGRQPTYQFEVLGKTHELVIWGEGNANPLRIIQDTGKIIEAESDIFGGLPYDRYVFLLHLSSQGYGGLEHKNSCTLNYSRFGFRALDKYHHYLQLVAHEFFHLWNIKRIRPKALETFDYDGENYTPSLWFSEGTTSYYDQIIPLRAGIYDVKAYLRELSKEITRFLLIPGRQVQPLAESSFDAWIKLYRRDANSDNSQISYYLKGAMVSLLLDLLIRERHQNQRSLDDVLRQLWQQFGQPEIGFTPEQLEEVITAVANTDLTGFFHHCLHTTKELPFEQYLAPFGLQLQAEDCSDRPPFLGMTVKTEHGRAMVKFVEIDSPAQRAGIDAGDELVAIDGIRVSAEQLGDRLKDYPTNSTLEVTIFHQDELHTRSVTLLPPRPTSYQLVPVQNPSTTQEQNFLGWLNCKLSSL